MNTTNTTIFQNFTRDEALQLLLRGLQARRAEIDAVQRDLRAQLNPTVTVTGNMNAEAVGIFKRRKVSAAGRRRMADAQRARWAKVRSMVKQSF